MTKRRTSCAAKRAAAALFILAGFVWAAHAAGEQVGPTGPFVVGGQRKHAAILVEQPLPRGLARVPAELADYLERITGARVPVARNAGRLPDGDVLVIRIGRSDYIDGLGLQLDELHIDGYVISLVDASNLVISGGARLGAGIGAYDFLKKVCGVRWFMPGPLGEVVPRKAEIHLDGLDIRSEPSVHSVWVRPVAIHNLRSSHFRRYHWAGHNLARVFPPAKYGETHPEYYPLIRGERRVPPAEGRRLPWQPCVTNPDLPRIAAEAAKGHFEDNPFVQVFSLGVNDGGGDCLCERCTALDAIRDGRRIMSDRYADFYNRSADAIAEAAPGKLLGFHAYGGITEPPSAPLRGNVYVRLTGGKGDILDHAEAWSRKAKHLGMYEYLYGKPVLEPRHYPHVLGGYVKRLVNDFGILSFAAELMPFWPFDAARYYVLSELLWDADQDVGALLDDFFGKFYGPAAGPMRRFFDRMEEVYGRRPQPLNFMDGYRRGGFHGWTEGDIAEMDRRMADAMQAAAEEPVRSRVLMVEEAWRHIRCWLIVYANTQEIAAMEVRTPRDAERAWALAKGIAAAMEERREWDAKVSSPENYPSAEYHRHYVASHYASPGPLVQTNTQAENAMDMAFCRVSAALGDGAQGHWQGVLDDPATPAFLAPLAQTQINLLTGEGLSENLIPHGDFEHRDRPPEAPEPEAPETVGWQRTADLPDGFSSWSYIGLPARFVWTDKVARSGHFSIGIEENEVRSSIVRSMPVQPGERYQVSVFATQTGERGPDEAGPGLTVAWQKRGEGWTSDARLTSEAQVPEPGQWAKASLRVTVPDQATHMVVMMGLRAPQLGTGGTYFDDLEVRRICDAPNAELPAGQRPDGG